MRVIIKFVDKWSKDVILLESVIVADLRELQDKLDKFKRIAGVNSTYQIIRGS